MEICPTVRDTCCSVFDQIEILQLWKKNSFFKVQDHYIELEKWDDKVMKMYYKFRKLSKSDMVFYYKQSTPAPYVHHFCTYRRFPIKSYPAKILGMNMEFMLPGRGPIREIDIGAIRDKEYRRIKKIGLDNKLPSYRFKKRSAEKFYKEFFQIATLMYLTRRLPYYHKKVIEAERRFKKLKFDGVLPKEKNIQLPPDSNPPSPKRAKFVAMRKKRNQKPETYQFTDDSNKKHEDEIKGLYTKKRGRKLKDDSQKGKESQEGKNGKPETSDYVDQNMETIKIKRRRKRKESGGDSDKLQFKPNIDFKTGKHKKRLNKKKIRKHQNRKLKDLKGKISKQWNQVFGNGKLPHPEQISNSPQMQSQGIILIYFFINF